MKPWSSIVTSSDRVKAAFSCSNQLNKLPVGLHFPLVVESRHISAGKTAKHAVFLFESWPSTREIAPVLLAPARRPKFREEGLRCECLVLCQALSPCTFFAWLAVMNAKNLVGVAELLRICSTMLVCGFNYKVKKGSSLSSRQQHASFGCIFAIAVAYQWFWPSLTELSPVG